MLGRELVRAARRVHTYGLRTAYSAILLGIGLIILREHLSRGLDTADLGQIGRALFAWFVTLQTLAVCLLAPLLVATGVQEERESRALDLLTLTGLSAGRILFEQISSRLFVLVLTVLAGLPFLGLLIGFGGFSVLAVVNSTVTTLTLALVLGSFAGFVALTSRGGPLVALVACVPYSLLVHWLLPLASMLILGMTASNHISWIYLGAGLGIDNTALPVLVTIPWGLALLGSWGLAVPVFSIVSSGDRDADSFGLLSPDIWRVERFRKRTWALAALAGFLTVVLILLRLANVASLPAVMGVGIVWFTTLLVAVQRQSLLAVLAFNRWIDRLLSSPIRLSGRVSVGPRQVKPDPVIWRELVTRAAGGARLLPLVLGGLWLTLAGLLRLNQGSRTHLHSGDAVLLLVLASAAAWLVALLVPTSLALAERRRRTLGLLRITSLTPWRIAVRKAVTPALLALPFVVAGNLAWAQASSIPIIEARLLLGAWTELMAINIGLVGATTALWVRPVRAGWVAALLASCAWVWWPYPVYLGLVEVLDWVSRSSGELVATLWLPFTDDDVLSRDGWVLLRAVGLQALAMPLLCGLLAWRIQRQPA